MICCELVGFGSFSNWVLFACHDIPYQREKKEFWSTLTNIIKTIEKPWVLIRDLNEVVDEEEKFGGHSIWQRMLFLKSFMDDIVTVDLGFVGSKYT